MLWGGARGLQHRLPVRQQALQRQGTLTSWVELFLVFAYPFYPFEGKREEIYSESLHDLFGQLETEKVLK